MKDDGGPAFPIQPREDAIFPKELSEVVKQFRGMSLRDWFAGQALTGYLANNITEGSFETFATNAYAQADAMLKAREK